MNIVTFILLHSVLFSKYYFFNGFYGNCLCVFPYSIGHHQPPSPKLVRLWWGWYFSLEPRQQQMPPDPALKSSFIFPPLFYTALSSYLPAGFFCHISNPPHEISPISTCISQIFQQPCHWSCMIFYASYLKGSIQPFCWGCSTIGAYLTSILFSLGTVSSMLHCTFRHW